MHNDTTLNMDNDKVTARNLLDISAAFDTMNRTILVDRLSVWYDVSRVALSWPKSYFSVSQQRVKIGVRFNISCCLSRIQFLNGFRFTNCTTRCVELLMNSHHLCEKCLYRRFSYIALNYPNTSWSLQQVRICFDDIFHWTNESISKLHADKIELFVIRKQRHRKQLKNVSLYPYLVRKLSTYQLGYALKKTLFFENIFIRFIKTVIIIICD